MLWGVLSGVMFPAALVYFLVTRLAKPIELTCKFCGYSLSRWHTVCSSCGRLLVRHAAGDQQQNKEDKKGFAPAAELLNLLPRPGPAPCTAE